MISYVVDGPVSEAELDQLFSAAWPAYVSRDTGPLVEASLYYVIAEREGELVGFLRVLECGSVRGFVLGPTVHPGAQGQGVGLALLEAAAKEGKERGLKQLHVEFASNLRSFYTRAGFRHTAAGVKRL